MCLNPITIPSQTRYVSLKYRDSYLFDVACGRCAECATTISNQWFYRAWYEYKDLPANGYCLFDCLTYSPRYLPHLSDYWTCLDKHNEDFPCFNPRHLRNFLQLLRTRLIRLGYANNAFRYFLATEYGTDKNATHRPHIHIMFYVHDIRLDPLFLSALVSELWKYGRTDGVPYKSRFYVMSHNCVKASDMLANKLRTCKYVTKYVQKSCLFQKEIDNRLNRVMLRLADIVSDNPDEWLQSEYAHRERLKLSRFVNQFHRQSQHFGESALSELDLNELEKNGCLFMPDNNGVKIPIPLPLYYKRKLFQEQIVIDGARYWVNTEYGNYYKQLRKEQTKKVLIDKYQCVSDQFHLALDNIPELVDYLFDIRGRIAGELPESNLFHRVSDVDLFNYATTSDKLNFGTRGLSMNWYGDPQRGYLSDRLRQKIPISYFIHKYCLFDDAMESELALIKRKMSVSQDSKQELYELKQELKDKFKPFLV